MRVEGPSGVSPKSLDIREYCDRCRRQQWASSIVGGRLCKRAADGATNVVVPFFLQKGTRPKEAEGKKGREAEIEVGKWISRGQESAARLAAEGIS